MASALLFLYFPFRPIRLKLNQSSPEELLVPVPQCHCHHHSRHHRYWHPFLVTQFYILPSAALASEFLFYCVCSTTNLSRKVSSWGTNRLYSEWLPCMDQDKDYEWLLLGQETREGRRRLIKIAHSINVIEAVYNGISTDSKGEKTTHRFPVLVVQGPWGSSSSPPFSSLVNSSPFASSL